MAPRKNAAAEKAAQTDATASAEITPAEAALTPENAPTVESGPDSSVAGQEPPTADDSEDEAGDLPEFVDVVVRPKHSVKHNGQHYGENAGLELPRVDAERLKAIGFVDYLDDLQTATRVSQGVAVSVASGVAITQEK